MSVLASLLSSAAFLVGLLLLFVGERLIGVGTSREMVSFLGVALVLGALVHRVLRLAKSQADRKGVERALLALEAVGVLGVVLYALQSDLSLKLLARPLAQASPHLAACLAVAWPVLIAASVLPLILSELAHAGMARSPVLEGGRIHEALFSGLGLAAVVVFAFAVVYVASARDPKWDLSYFHATRPGDSSRKLAQGLNEPVEVSLFFPPANEVHDRARDYFDLLAKSAGQITVSDHDYALEPKLARELGVTGNGAVVLTKGKRHEQIWLGTDLDHARSDFARFDSEVLKRLLSLSRGHQVVYLATGHGERSDERASVDDQRARISQLITLLRDQDIEVKRLGAAEGLSTKVPDNAAAVLVLGPATPFLPTEVDTLRRYLQGGGRLLLGFDPDAKADADALLQPLGLHFSTQLTCNDHIYVQRDYQISDRANIATASFSSHPAVTTLSQLGNRAPVVFSVAGHLEPTASAAKTAQVDFTVYAQPNSWNDVDGDFNFGKGEERKAWPLAAAVTVHDPAKKGGPEGRAVVVADSDVFSDGLIQVSGNAYLALDSIRWLTNQESISGQISNEGDVPIEHTRSQDVAWFYLTIFVAPALVLAAGAGVTRRKRRAR